MNLKIISILLALLLAAMFAGCDAFAKPDTDTGGDTAESEASVDEEFPVSLNGAAVESRPGVIVSLSPAITEKLSDLQLQGKLEGISDYCDAPQGAERTRVGTVQLLDLDALQKLSPHLVLTEVAFTEAEASMIRAMGAQIAVIPRADNIDGVLKNYKNIAMLLEGSKTGAALGEAFEKKFMQKYNSIVENGLTEPKNALYLRLLDFTIATGDTLEGKLMQAVGLHNIAQDYTEWQYPEDAANAEDGRQSFVALDYIYCDERAVTIKMLEKSAFYKGLDVVLKDRYLYIDSTAFERQTLRMLDELDRMRLYALGEIPGSKEEAEAAASAAASVDA